MSLEQSREAVLRRANDLRKRISEANLMDKLRDEIEIKMRNCKENRKAMETLQNILENDEKITYEDAFRTLGGEEFAEQCKDESLDMILMKLATVQSEKLEEHDMEELYKIFAKVVSECDTRCK